MISPNCSPWRIETLRPGIRITNVFIPVAAPVIDLSSKMVAEAGIIDPSEAHVRPSVVLDGLKPETRTRFRINSSAWFHLMCLGIASSVVPQRRSSI
jgi:hypothetical protein